MNHSKLSITATHTFLPRRWLLLVSGFLLFSLSLYSADWPQRLGPLQNGFSPAKDLPGSWSKVDNVAWRLPLPVKGDATPVVSRDYVFTVSYEARNKALVAVAIQRATGKQVWRNYLSSSRPSLLGDERMLDAVVVADDRNAVFQTMAGELSVFENSGRQLWHKNWRQEFTARDGAEAFSPGVTIDAGRVYLPVYQGKVLTVLCFEQITGKLVWKVSDESIAASMPNSITSSPIVMTDKQRVHVLQMNGKSVLDLDAVGGTIIRRWNLPDSSDDLLIAFLMPAEDGVIVGGSKRRKLVCLESASFASRWELGFGGSFAAYGGDFISLNSSSKTLTRIDAKTGRTKWRLELPTDKTFIAQPTAGAGKIYCLSGEGNVVLVSAEEGTLLGEISMAEASAEKAMSSVALAQGQLFIQTPDTLYCIGKVTKTEGPTGITGRPTPDVRVGEPDMPKRRLPL